MMLKHYIKFAIRNFRSNKIIFGGSLLTLCLGTLCISLLFSYVPDQLQMDGFHKRQQHIYTIAIKKSPQSLPRLPGLRRNSEPNHNDYPDLEHETIVVKYPKGFLKMIYCIETYCSNGAYCLNG